MSRSGAKSDGGYIMTAAEALVERAVQNAQRLQDRDSLLDACAVTQNRIPEGRVVADCGSVALTILPLGGGRAVIQIVVNSFGGPISSVAFVGEWIKLGFPPAGGAYTPANSKTRGLGGENVIITSEISPGAGNIFTNLTVFEATTARGPCIGLLPSDVKEIR